MKRIALITLFTACCGFIAAQYRLWYDKPAQTWTQALPVGNGVIGGMVFGTPAVEHIQLNEETIWAGQPNNVVNPNAKAALPEVRRLIFEGKYKEAQELADAKVMPRAVDKNMGMPYQPFGDLYIAMPGHAEYKNYERWLDLNNAKSIVRYSVDGVQYEREVITPLGGNHVIAIHLNASEKGKITFTANMTTPHENPLVSMDGNEATLLGVSSKHEGLKGKVRFMGRMAVQTKGGRTTGSNGNISVVGADEAIIYVAIGTNVKSYKDITGDEEAQSKERLHQAMALGYEALKAQHEREYHKYYDRVKLDLGPDIYANVPMNKRIERFSVVSDSVADNHLVATYFQFGRYLLISSSQPDNMNPANLQGIWNEKMFPSWDSKYTTNINLEMNYWPSEVTNLTEMNEPLFRLIRECYEQGKETARDMYGAEGWASNANTPKPLQNELYACCLFIAGIFPFLCFNRSQIESCAVRSAVIHAIRGNLKISAITVSFDDVIELQYHRFFSEQSVSVIRTLRSCYPCLCRCIESKSHHDLRSFLVRSIEATISIRSCDLIYDVAFFHCC